MNKTAVGIDIGRSNTKVVVIEQKESFVLRDAFLFSTPFVLQDDRKRNIDEERFLELLYEKIPLEVLRNVRIGVNVEQNSLIVIPLVLPFMSQKELEIAAQLEARRRMVAQPVEQSVFRYIKGKKTTNRKENKIEVLVIRSDKNAVESILNIFQRQGLTPSLAAPPASLLFNLVRKPSQASSGDVAFVDIGSEAMNVSIYREDKFVFFRNIAYGLKKIIHSLASSLGVSSEYAQQVVEQVDIVNIERSGEENILKEKTSINPYALKILWQHNIERIIQELRRTLIYYKEASGGRRVARFLFLGGGAQVKNLISLAIAQIGGSSEVVNPFSSLSEVAKHWEKDGEMPIFANAVALALQTFNLSPQVPNFLPFSLQKKYLYLKRQLIVRYILVFFIFLSSLFSFKLFYLLRSLSQEERDLTRELKKLEPVVKKNQEIKQQLKQVYDKINQLKAIVAENPPFYAILEKLPAVVPFEVVLTHLSLKPQAELSPQPSSLPSRDAFSRSRGFSRTTPAKESSYYLQGEGEFVGTYEELRQITNVFKKNLQRISELENIEIEFQSIEQIAPYRYTTKDGVTQLSFTKPKLRTFSFKAKLKKRSE